MKEITLDEWANLRKHHCDKGKHRFRTNHFGVAWCTICGSLSNKDFPLVEEDEKIKIILT